MCRHRCTDTQTHMRLLHLLASAIAVLEGALPHWHGQTRIFFHKERQKVLHAVCQAGCQHALGSRAALIIQGCQLRLALCGTWHDNSMSDNHWWWFENNGVSKARGDYALQWLCMHWLTNDGKGLPSCYATTHLIMHALVSQWTVVKFCLLLWYHAFDYACIGEPMMVKCCLLLCCSSL